MKAGGKEGPVYILRVERCCEGGGGEEMNGKDDFERSGEPRERCVWRRSREVRLYTRIETRRFVNARNPFAS
jgi:hypothetical protein